MNCDEFKADFGLIPSQSLPEEAAEHLHGCPPCMEYVQEMSELGVACQALIAHSTASPGALDRVRAATLLQIRQQPAFIPDSELEKDLRPLEDSLLLEEAPVLPAPSRAERGWLAPLAIAAGFAFAIFGSQWLSFQPSRDPGRNISRSEPVETLNIRDAFEPVPTSVGGPEQVVHQIPEGIHPGFFEYSLIEVENPNSVTNRPPEQNWPSSRDRSPGNSGLLPASNGGFR